MSGVEGEWKGGFRFLLDIGKKNFGINFLILKIEE